MSRTTNQSAAKNASPKTAARKTASRKTAARKTAARKTASRKTAARKTAARKTTAPSTPSNGPSLRERMSQDLQLRGMAKRTHDGYLREVRKLACHYNAAPDTLSERQVTDDLLYLINVRKFAPGSLSVAYSGIKFFYTFTEPRDWEMLKKLRLPKQRSLPSVLTIDEVHRLIGAVRQHRNAAYFWTVYSLGLWLEEGLHLHGGDVDATRMMVHVHRGKGAKDRCLPLPKSTLAILRDYWSTHRHPTLLFPAIGRNKKTASTTSRPMDATTVQGCMKRVVEKLQFKKKISTRTSTAWRSATTASWPWTNRA